MKKYIAVLMSVLMLGAIACTVKPAADGTDPEEQNTEEHTDLGQTETGAVTGGWQIEAVGADRLPEDAQNAFDLVTEKLIGADYVPIALLGTQVVAGMNYAILCTRTPVVQNPQTDLAVLIIYVDLQGEAELLNIADFDLGAYAEKEDSGAPEQLMGGWFAPEAEGLTSLPQDAATAFSAALDGFTGNSLVPVAFLGRQIVAGKNYAFLCHSTLATLDPVTSMQLVYVYEDLEGGTSITHIVTVDPGEFN